MPQAAIPIAASVAGSAASTLLSRGGGGGGGGGSPAYTITNPAAKPLANLFGATVTPGTGGGVSYGGANPAYAQKLQSNAVFGTPQFRSSLQDFLYNPAGLSPAEEAVTSSLLQNPAAAQGLLNQTQGGLGLLAGYGQDLARTGFATDATPLYQRAAQQLKNQILPDIAERVGSQVGLNSQSFIDAATQASSDLLGQAAAQNVGLQEAAAQRRIAGLPLSANLFQQQLATPLAFAQDLLGLGGNVRSITEEARSRPLTAFQQLAGLSPSVSSGYALQGYNPQGSGASSALATLAQNPALMQGVTSLAQSGLQGVGNFISNVPSYTSNALQGIGSFFGLGGGTASASGA